ncbi:transposable element Tcb1 transposase [Trichonephila clavipes]|nr:transposable element Tcb1 transposase [Trichonephila clavipes]
MSPTGERSDEGTSDPENPFGPQERQTRISKAPTKTVRKSTLNGDFSTMNDPRFVLHQENRIPNQSAFKLGLDGPFTFQQDNDPKHTARVVGEWLLYNGRKQVKTPPQSPDLNPIEHLWDYLDRQIRKQEIKTKNDLKKAHLEEWQKIPSSVTQNLVKSMPSRLKAVIKAKGYPTNY